MPVQFMPPKDVNPWNSMPQAIDSLVQGVTAIREKILLPQDFKMLGESQADLQSGTANYPELISKMKTQAGRKLVAGIWQKQLEAASNYTTVYNPQDQSMTKVPGKKVVVDPTAVEAQRQEGRNKLEDRRENLRLKLEDLKDQRQQRQLSVTEERQARQFQQQFDLLDKRLENQQKTGASDEDTKTIVDGLKRGDIAPDQLSKRNTKGEYTKILSGALKEGLSLSSLSKQYNAAKRFSASMNSQQMVRFKGLAGSVVNTIDEVKTLSDQMKLSGVPLLNRAELAAYVQTRGNTPGGQLATKYLAAVNTLKEEFANLAQGGYAPTEATWALANKQINENYGIKQMDASLTEVQRLINYRIQAFDDLEPSMAGTGGKGAGAPGKGIQAPAGKATIRTTPGKVSQYVGPGKYNGVVITSEDQFNQLFGGQ